MPAPTRSSGVPWACPAARPDQVRLFIDECLSPEFALRLAEAGHDAIHPLHVGRRGEADHTVRDRCLAEDRVIVTENIGDFKALLSREAIHPGLIALPQGSKQQSWALLIKALQFLEGHGGESMDRMVNACLEFDADGEPVLAPLP